jgi:NADH-quinone oxidoreductase subunit N
MLNSQIIHIIESLPVFRAELWLAIVFLLGTIASIFISENRRSFAWGMVLAILCELFWLDWSGAPTQLFLGAIVTGKSGFKALFAIGAALALILDLRNGQPRLSSSQYLLFPLLLLGANIMVASHNLITLYLSVETASLAAYGLVALGMGKKPSEATLKYLLFGGASAAAMLYGMTWLYGLSGHLNYQEVFAEEAVYQTLMGRIALIMLLGGVLFKMAAVPFHIWSPDLYANASPTLAAFFSAVPKVAGAAVVVSITACMPIDFSMQWTKMIGVLALISMILGNMAALKQTEAKRMLAYSSIANAGFMLVPAAAYLPPAPSWEALGFYAATYMLATFAAFALADWAEKDEDGAPLSHFAGLGKQYWPLGIATVVVMISLVGLPITGGFTAKLFIFTELWNSYQVSFSNWKMIVLVLGLANAVVSLFYYLHIPYRMFFKEAEAKLESPSVFIQAYIIIMALLLLLLFIWPQWIMGFFA